MAVENKQQSQSEKISELRNTRSKEDGLIGDLADSDLITELAEDYDENGVKKPKEEIETAEEQDEEEETEEESEDNSEEESEEVEDEEEESEEDDEELIPRSKVDKRFAKLTAEKKALEARLKALEETQAKEKDPDLVKLESMNKGQIKNLLEEVEFEKLKAFKEDDDVRFKQLKSLETKIKDYLENLPTLQQQARQKAWQNAVNTIQLDPEIELTDKAAKEIKSYATIIYQKSKSLQSSPEGEGEALLMAAEHYKQFNKAPKDKSGEKALKRKVNKLKKKTSLEGKTIKGDLKGQNLKKLKSKAKSPNADEYDKLDYFKQSGIVDIDSLM